MTEFIKKSNGNVKVKFHKSVVNFKRIEKISYNKKYFRVYVDKNNAVYDVKQCTVLSWKKVGRKSVPEQIEEVRDTYFLNIVKGNPYKLAFNRIITELEYNN